MCCLHPEMMTTMVTISSITATVEKLGKDADWPGLKAV